MVLWLAGMKYTQVSIAALLNQTSTVFIVIMAAIFLKEGITLRKAISVGLAVLGSILVISS